jgi:hypothetical protein
MKRLVLFLCVAVLSLPRTGQAATPLENAEFKGYIQIRAEDNFNGPSGFLLRRLKMWLRSNPELSPWSYKIQATFSGLSGEKFFLQDVKIGYRSGNFSCDLGQFVPQFSLQRFQHDYRLPVLERARVINVLIPNGTLGVRDVGLQFNYENTRSHIRTHFGIFNGYGIKHFRSDNKGYLLTHKTSLGMFHGMPHFRVGYSLQYRKADRLWLKDILPDSVRFSGDDFRYNVFAVFREKCLTVQAEYLQAILGGHKAWGYYVLGSVSLHKHQLAVECEEYKDSIVSTRDGSFARLDYNYLWQSYKTKFSLDYYFPLTHTSPKASVISCQIQLFL